MPAPVLGARGRNPAARRIPLKPIDDRFHEYFEALDRAGNHDRCYLCRRTSAEVTSGAPGMVPIAIAVVGSMTEKGPG